MNQLLSALFLRLILSHSSSSPQTNAAPGSLSGGVKGTAEHAEASADRGRRRQLGHRLEVGQPHRPDVTVRVAERAVILLSDCSDSRLQAMQAMSCSDRSDLETFFRACRGFERQVQCCPLSAGFPPPLGVLEAACAHKRSMGSRFDNASLNMSWGDPNYHVASHSPRPRARPATTARFLGT